MNHLDVWELEKASENSDAGWLAWIRTTERELGISDLDGDEGVEGYSLDSAYDAYLGGVTPADYAAGTRVEKGCVVKRSEKAPDSPKSAKD